MHSTNTVDVTLCPLPVSSDQLVDQVAAAGMVPQVMVRVTDGQVRLEDVLLHLREPLIAVRGHRAIPKAAALSAGSDEASSRSRTRRRSWPIAVSAQNHRVISSPPAAGRIAMPPSR